MKEDQIKKLRQSLVNELIDAIERHAIDVGCGLCQSDIIGALEWVKLHYYLECMDLK